MFLSVITTIAEPTTCVRELCLKLEQYDSRLIVVGDKKGPQEYDIPNTDFLSLENQLKLPFSLAKKLPTGHYTRKNLGYLYAMSKGALCIYETDDDNAPLATWEIRKKELDIVDTIKSNHNWVNIYKYFSKENIWPRGLPLDEINSAGYSLAKEYNIMAPIQQGLVNNSPDVDAIWRLVMDRPFDFEDRPSIRVPKGIWCPFNTQSTWWFPEVYVLMYIPSFCSFRMCDIWKSFIAQRCLWELDCGIVFHASEVYQDRNNHSLMRDFNDEIPGYTGNYKMCDILGKLTLKKGIDAVSENILLCYEALVEHNFFPKEELELLNSWIADVKLLKEKENEK